MNWAVVSISDYHLVRIYWFCVTLMFNPLNTSGRFSGLPGIYSLSVRETRVQRVNFTDWFCFQRWIYEFFRVFSEIKCFYGNGSSRWQNVTWDFSLLLSSWDFVDYDQLVYVVWLYKWLWLCIICDFCIWLLWSLIVEILKCLMMIFVANPLSVYSNSWRW